MESGRKLGIEFVTVAHESSAAIAAAYYGKVKNTSGVAIAIKGVGAANLVGGAVNAYFERMPVVLVCETARVPGGPPHALARNQMQCLPGESHAQLLGALVPKYVATVSADEIAAQLADAVHAATDGRPGVALLDVPGGVSSQTAKEQTVSATPTAVEPPPPTMQVMLLVLVLLLMLKLTLMMLQGAATAKRISSATFARR